MKMPSLFFAAWSCEQILLVLVFGNIQCQHAPSYPEHHQVFMYQNFTEHGRIHVATKCQFGCGVMVFVKYCNVLYWKFHTCMRKSVDVHSDLRMYYLGSLLYVRVDSTFQCTKLNFSFPVNNYTLFISIIDYSNQL